MDAPALFSGRLRERLINPYERPSLPFLNAPTPDAYARIIERRYLMDPTRYVPRCHKRTSVSSGFSRTEDFTHADWTRTNLTATADQVANPADGLVTADKLLETVTNGERKVSRAFTFTEQSHVLSIFARYLDREWLRLVANDGTEDFEHWFNLRTGQSKPFADRINATTLNGGFETAGGGGGGDVLGTWEESIAGGTSTLARDTTVFRSGAASARLAIDAASNTVAIGQYVLQAGRRFRYGIWAKNDGTGSLVVTDSFFGGLTTIIPLTPNWAYYTGEFVAGGSGFTIFCNTASSTVWIDDVVITPLEPAPVLNDLLRNGGFETAGGGGGDIFGAWTENIGGGTSALTRDTVVFHGGNASAKFAVDASGNAATLGQTILQVGRRYRYGLWAKNGGSGNLVVTDAFAGGVTDTIPLTTNWTYYSGEFTAAASSFFLFCNTASTNVWVDDVSLTPLGLPDAYLQRQPAPGEDWWRCSIVMPWVRAGAGTTTYALSTDGTILSYAGDTAKGAYLWGANCRPGTVPGPYISALGSARTIAAPDNDAGVNFPAAIEADPFAWQTAESQQVEVIDSRRGRISRTFCRCPAPQSRDDVESFSRPSAHGLKSGSTYAIAFPDDGHTDRFFGSRKVVSSAATVPGDTLPGTMPSGNITLYDSAGHTAVFAANAPQGTIQAALNGLAAYGVITSPSCSVVVGRITVSWNVGTGYMASYSLPGGVVYGAGGLGVSNYLSFVTTATITTPDVRRLAITSHGALAGDKIALFTGDSVVGLGVVAAVADADTITVLCSDLNQPDVLVSHAVFAPQAVARYVTGARQIRCVRTTEFVLPGVSMKADGSTINTLADVAPVTVNTDGQSWLDRIVTGDALVPIAGSQFAQYAGPISQRETVFLRMSDALEAVAV